VVEGLADLPWHRDCGLGGHPVLCPALNIGIQLDRADAENGQLHFLAGSHRSSGAPPAPGDDSLPVLAVETAPGDVTVHFGHVLHAAPPPTSPTAGRRALYVGFVPPALFDVIGPRQGYNDVLFTEQPDGHVASVDERLARTTT
jgi:ectoine hydroxylase-related dioxygenase (phytanoyl-CoA dioxygenase family)